MLLNKYEILKKIGSGGTSKVYLALDTKLNKYWAVKEINKSREVSALAIKEAYLMKDFNHPTLPRIVEISETSQYIYIVMDYIEGIPLSRVLNERGRFSQKQVISWAVTLCDTLVFLHNHNPPIIHRDLKPGNIIVDSNSNIKLIDFGIAREYKVGGNRDTMYLGTRGYAAPEQFKGIGQTDERTDIYSFGVTIYTLLTGKDPSAPPYELYPIRKWDENLSAGLESIILKCTKEDPKARYQNADELKYALTHIKEEDKEYVLKERKKLQIFVLSVSISILGFAMGVAGIVARANLLANDYETNLSIAKTASNPETAIEAYSKVIDIRPGELSGYLGLIDMAKEDADFDMQEEEMLVRKINQNINQVKSGKDYGLLAYSLGKLYWYYYDYGKEENSINITGIKNSLGWFEDAAVNLDDNSNEYKSAVIYRGIARFNKDIITDIEEAGDYGKYITYFNDLNGLLDDVKNESNEMMRLVAARLCMSSMIMYSQKFKEDGVNYTQAYDFYGELKRIIDKTSVNTDKTVKLKNELINQKSIVADLVERWEVNG